MPDVRMPPRFSQPSQLEPFHHLWYMGLSVPRTKVSIRLDPQETAAGAEVKNAAQVLPAEPTGAVPPLVVHGVVGAADEKSSGWPPRRRRRRPR